jgi:hypothetical protein
MINPGLNSIGFLHTLKALYSKITQPSMDTSCQHCHESNPVWLNSFILHLLKQSDSFSSIPMLSVAGNHRIPRNYIPRTHLTKQLASTL